VFRTKKEDVLNRLEGKYEVPADNCANFAIGSAYAHRSACAIGSLVKGEKLNAGAIARARIHRMVRNWFAGLKLPSSGRPGEDWAVRLARILD